MDSILMIDTATEIGSVALLTVDHGEIASVKQAVLPKANQHASQISVLVDQLIGDTGTTYQDLAAVSVNVGPGSYTGLRVGMSFAKGLCFGLQIPLIEVPGLVALASAAQQQLGPIWDEPQHLHIAMIDARRMEVYAGYFESRLHPTKPYAAEVVSDDSWADRLQAGWQITLSGNGAPKVVDFLGEKKRIKDTHIRNEASHLAVPTLQRWHKQEFASLAYTEPLYIKSPNITRSKKRW